MIGTHRTDDNFPDADVESCAVLPTGLCQKTRPSRRRRP